MDNAWLATRPAEVNVAWPACTEVLGALSTRVSATKAKHASLELSFARPPDFVGHGSMPPRVPHITALTLPDRARIETILQDARYYFGIDLGTTSSSRVPRQRCDRQNLPTTCPYEIRPPEKRRADRECGKPRNVSVRLAP